MKIYFAHSTQFDYKKEFYEPLKNSSLARAHELIFPHEDDVFMDTKEIIATSDLVVAEVSYPSTGLGIELGWADSIGIPVLAVYKSGAAVSRSLTVITHDVISYDSGDKLIELVTQNIETL